MNNDKQTTRFIASQEDDGSITVHGQPFELPNDYDTLCGLEVGQGNCTPDRVAVPKGEKINCKQCKSVWLAGKNFKKGDFL